jgi:hypothetical protein
MFAWARWKAGCLASLTGRRAARWQHELNFHLRVPQPWPERQNEAERKAFLEGHVRVCAKRLKKFCGIPPGAVYSEQWKQ